MNGRSQRAPRFARRALALALAAACGSVSGGASAFGFETENVKGSFDSTISFGMQWRMQGTNCGIVGNDNGGCVPTTGTLGELVNGPGQGATSNPDAGRSAPRCWAIRRRR